MGLELLFTVCEENGAAGAKRSTLGRLRREFGYVFDHATPIGEVIIASPTYFRIGAEFHGRAAHAGIRPEDGPQRRARRRPRRSRRCRSGASTRRRPPTSATIDGRRRLDQRRARALRRCSPRPARWTPTRVEDVVAAMIDAIQDGAAAAECDVDVTTEKLFAGYRQKPSSPAVAAAEAALRACGYEPRRIATGGGSDANAFEAARLPVREPRQRHRAQPRADRARVRRRAGGHARRGVRAPRRGGRACHELPLRAHRQRDRLRGRLLHRPPATRSATRTARRPSARSSRTPARSASSRSTASTLWLVRQPREAVGVPDLLEIPAGKLDEEGEDAAGHRQARAGRGDRQAAPRLGAARRSSTRRPASPTRSCTCSSPRASPTSTSAPRSTRTSASTSRPGRWPSSTR